MKLMSNNSQSQALPSLSIATAKPTSKVKKLLQG